VSLATSEQGVIVHTSRIYGSDDDGELEARFRRLSPPDNEIPVPLGLRVEIHRTADVAVALVGGHAYSTGVELAFTVRVRPGSLSPEQRRARMAPSPFESELLVGIELPDGQVVSTLASHPWAEPGGPSDDAPVLVLAQGSSSDTSVDQSLWLTPPPGHGRLAFVVAHPGLGVPEVRFELDAGPIADACASVVELWPWERQGEDPFPAAEPEVPPGGWFERHRTASEHDDG
jgi:hypothetical protein